MKEILANGYAYESNGSVYFDIEKYNKEHAYGILSHRNHIRRVQVVVHGLGAALTPPTSRSCTASSSTCEAS